MPLPEYMLALGDARSAAGDMTGAAQSYDVARAEIRLFEASGVSYVDLLDRLLRYAIERHEAEQKYRY